MWKSVLLCCLAVVAVVSAVDHDVIIIGSGASGMTAAGIMGSIGKGKNVLVLEARDTYGGRIRTDYTLGFPWGIGPMWIDGIGRYSGDSFEDSPAARREFDSCGKNGNPYSLPEGKLCQPVEAICTNYDIEYRIQADNSEYWDYDGTWLGYDQACQSDLYSPLVYPKPLTPNPGPIPESIVDTWGDGSNTSTLHGWLDYNAPSLKNDVPLQVGIDTCPIDFTGTAFETPRYKDWQLESYLTCDYGAETYQPSWHDNDYDGYFNDVDGTITRSYQLVADALHQTALNYGVTFQYNSEVDMVDPHKGEITYHDVETGDKKTISAKKIICTASFVNYKKDDERTVPTFEIKDVPQNFTTALSHMRQGILEKTMLSFKTNFWRNSEPTVRNSTGWLMHISEVHGEFPEFNTMDNWNDQNWLVTWAGGDYGKELVMKSDKEVQDKIQEIINMMWPNAGKDAEIQQMVRSNWTNDRYTQGCYSFEGVDYDRHTDHKALLGPIGNMYFGGEHTRKDHFGSVEGAIWSGTDASNVVCQSLGWLHNGEFVYHPDTIADAVRWKD